MKVEFSRDLNAGDSIWIHHTSLELDSVHTGQVP